jgi:hypothetical protein
MQSSESRCYQKDPQNAAFRARSRPINRFAVFSSLNFGESCCNILKQIINRHHDSAHHIHDDLDPAANYWTTFTIVTRLWTIVPDQYCRMQKSGRGRAGPYVPYCITEARVTLIRRVQLDTDRFIEGFDCCHP